jgi:DNA-binding NarL/FixJ family response regulator
MRAWRVLIVDDHRAFGGALAARLSTEPDMQVVSVVATGREALEALEATEVDLVLLDLTLAGESGLEVARAMFERRGGLAVLVVTEVEDAAAASEAVRAGVAGWVPKHRPVDELLAAARGVLAGETWYPPRLLTGVFARLSVPAGDDEVLGRLTRREQEVLACMVEGLDRQGIAERLYLSANTVRTHVQNLMAKLGVHSGPEAVSVAVRAGFGARRP